MSIREITLQRRVDALEEAVDGLCVTISQHLPASSGMCDSVRSILLDSSKQNENFVARTVAASRIVSCLTHDTALDYPSLHQLLRIFVPMFMQVDKEERFLKKSRSGGPYMLTGNSWTLDLTSILHSGIGSLNPTGVASRLQLHFSEQSHISRGFNIDGISGTELHQGDWVSYAVEYSTDTLPLFEKQFIQAMDAALRDLDRSDWMINPNFQLNGTRGIVHGLTLNHHSWESNPVLCDEPIDGRGAILRPKNTIKDFDGKYHINLFVKEDVEFEISIHDQGHYYTLTCTGGSNGLTLIDHPHGSHIAPRDMSILARARLHTLAQFVEEIFKGERKELLYKDPTGVAVGWEVTPIPHLQTEE